MLCRPRFPPTVIAATKASIEGDRRRFRPRGPKTQNLINNRGGDGSRKGARDITDKIVGKSGYPISVPSQPCRLGAARNTIDGHCMKRGFICRCRRYTDDVEQNSDAYDHNEDDY